MITLTTFARLPWLCLVGVAESEDAVTDFVKGSQMARKAAMTAAKIATDTTKHEFMKSSTKDFTHEARVARAQRGGCDEPHQ